MIMQPSPMGAKHILRNEQAKDDPASGLGGSQTGGRGANSHQRPQSEAIAEFEAALTSAVPLDASLRRVPKTDEHDTLPIALHLQPTLALIVPGQPLSSPALVPERAAELVALAEKVSAEIRSALAVNPKLMADGFLLKLDLGRSMLGVQSMTLQFSPGTIHLSLTLIPGGAAHDLAMAMQVLAAALAIRHPTRTIRIDEDRESGVAADRAQEYPFNPLTMPITRL